ncbi:MAG: 30S ribosomal protein S13 [archaeon]
MASREFRHIVRIKGTDIDGSKKIVYGLTKIRGLGIATSSAIVQASNLKPDLRIGQLTPEEVGTIENIMIDPVKHGIPGRMTNRQHDPVTGRDLHLVGPDLILRIKTDIDFMKDIRSWKGIRHSLGLKVRGQRTKTTGRKGKAVGVQKKVAIAALRAAAKAEE